MFGNIPNMISNLALGLTLSVFILSSFACSVNEEGMQDETDEMKGEEESCQSISCLEPPKLGFQVRNEGTTINPGEDVEYCEVIKLPGTPDLKYYVNRFEAAMTEGSHHLIVSAVRSDSETEATMEEHLGKKVKCTGANDFGEDFVPVTGSQTPYSNVQYPEGIGRIYTGGQYLVFDYHYLNTTEEPIQAQAIINFHTVEKDQIEKIAQGFGFYNLNIYTAPRSTSSHTGECVFKEDIHLYSLTRHTHQWGTDFSVWYKGGENDGELVWTSGNYEEDLNYVWKESILMKKGTGFRFQCNYLNDTDEPLVFGLQATDEMCILFGTWWKVDGTETKSHSCQLF